jgi:outer membrane protein TolC
VGEANLLEIIDARRAALSAEASVIDARERAAQAFIDLVIATGGDPATPQPVLPIPSTAPAGAQP